MGPLKKIDMNRSTNNIDQSFKNGADALQVLPSEDAWTKINQGLNQSRTRSTRLYLITRFAAVIIPFALLVAFGAYYYTSSQNYEVVEVASSTEDIYYSDYLGFIKSDEYASLALAYSTVE